MGPASTASAGPPLASDRTGSLNLRIAVVGCGLITEQLHLPAIIRAEGVQAEALIDSDLNRATALAQTFSVPHAVQKISDVAGLVDAVLIATPPHVRVDMMRESLHHNLHVLCEKPLANTVAECEAMRRLSEATDRVTAVAHVYRFWPVREYLANALPANEFGRPVHVFASQGNPYSWKSVTGYTVRRDMVPGGVLINAGIHPLDTLLWWFGEVSSVEYRDDALGGLESNCDVDVRFRQGVTARLVMSRTTRLNHIFRIETDSCLIELPTYSRHEFTVREGDRTRTIQVAEPSDDALLPAIAQINDFAQAVKNGSPPRVSIAEGMRVISLVESCYKAKRSRQLPRLAPVPGELW